MPIKKGCDKIAIIGSGPIVIGQACEIDCSGGPAGFFKKRASLRKGKGKNAN